MIDENCAGVATCDAVVEVYQCVHYLVLVDMHQDNNCILLNPASVCVSNYCFESTDPINLSPR